MSPTTSGSTYPLVLHEVTGERQPLELYDLSRDPNERHNLAGDPDYAEIENTLRRRLWQWMEDTGDPLRHGPVRSPFYDNSRNLLSAA